MENTVWLLFEDSNVARKDEKEFSGVKKEFRVFSKFEDAVRAMRKVIHAHAFADNALFDGNGHIREFEKYIERNAAAIDDFDDDFENGSTKPLKAVSEKLRSFFASQTDYPEISQLDGFSWTDWLCGCECETQNGHSLLTIEGVDDGPCNGINPDIYINSFVMDDPEITNYVCRIRDSFEEDWDEEPHYVHIELLKTALE
ncbi:MAG: hypothetical protein J1E00_05980 [Oscillospiraceae bacterium]|nr:hypothetical protein [Oscillospiraceae bacterium]